MSMKSRTPAEVFEAEHVKVTKRMEALGVRGICQHVIFEKMIKAATNDGQDFKLMVLDTEGTRILGGICRMSEIVNLGITHVEDLYKPRQPQPALGAVYFVAPTEASIRHILNDFHPERRDKVLYKEAWLFFTSKIPDKIFEIIHKEIETNKAFKRSLKICRELNLEFLPVERNVFSLGMPELFCQLYRIRTGGEPCGVHRNYDRIVDRLFHVCINFGQIPDICYYENSASGNNHRLEVQLRTDIQEIARILRHTLDTFATDNARILEEMNEVFDAQFNIARGKGGRQERSLLVILDRSADPAGPLLHDPHYQSMIEDICAGEIKDGDIALGRDKKVVSLNDRDDAVWQVEKYRHFLDVIDRLKQHLERINAKYPSCAEYNKRKQGSQSLTGMKDVVVQMVSFKQEMGHYSKNRDLMELLLRYWQQRGCGVPLTKEGGESQSLAHELFCMEQNMLYGRDYYNDELSEKELGTNSSNLLKSPGMSPEDKMRLLLVLCMAQRDKKDVARLPEGPPKQLEELERLAGVGEDARWQKAKARFQDMMVNLDMGVSDEHKVSGLSGSKHATYGYGKSRRHWKTEPAGEERALIEESKSGSEVPGPDQVSRYVPTLYWLMKDLCKGRKAPRPDLWRGLYAAKPGHESKLEETFQCDSQWESYGSKRRLVPKRKVIIICVLGGITHAEMRAADEIERRTGSTVIIGGSEVLTPNKYLERMTCEGDWTQVPRGKVPAAYSARDAGPSGAQASQAGARASQGCLETRLPCIFGEHPSPIFKTLCCDDSMPPATEGRP